MVQEIITYSIVGTAVILAITKVAKRFRKKKAKKTDFRKTKITTEHNCTDCAAECVLRDLPKRIKETKLEVCTTNYNAKKTD